MNAPLNIKTCNSLLKSMIQIEKLIKIAKENNTSFNNVVISMIEECLKKNWIFSVFFI